MYDCLNWCKIKTKRRSARSRLLLKTITLTLNLTLAITLILVETHPKVPNPTSARPASLLEPLVIWHTPLADYFGSFYFKYSGGSNLTWLMDDLRFRQIFNLGITKDISGKKLSKLEKLQSLVAKCCKIRKI